MAEQFPEGGLARLLLRVLCCGHTGHRTEPAGWPRTLEPAVASVAR